MAFQDSLNKFNRGAVGQGLGAFFQGTTRGQVQQQQMQLDDQRKGAMAKDAFQALTFLDAGDFNSVNTLLEQRGQMIRQLGGDPSDTAELQQRLQAGDIEGVRNDLATVVKGAQAVGYLPKPKVEAPYTLGEGQTRFGPNGEVIARGSAAPDKNKDERLKEVRGGMRALKKTLNTEATAIVNNYGKVNKLAKLAKSGNRTAVAQLGISLVKLGDPGSIVKEEELRQAFAAKDTSAALADLVSQGKLDGSVVDSVLVTLDPLNPQNINIPNILSTADALVGAAIPNWENRFNQLAEQGTRVSEAGRDDILTKSFLSLRDNLAGISKGRSTGGGSASLGASGLPDGATATGPNGQKIKSVNGQWVAQ